MIEVSPGRGRGQSGGSPQTGREVVLDTARHSLVRADGSHARQLEGHPGPERGIDLLTGRLASLHRWGVRNTNHGLCLKIE
jgi:hypothetical protein